MFAFVVLDLPFQY